MWHRSLSGRRARGQRRACEIDLRGARPAPAACAALCVAMEMVAGGRRRWFVGGDRVAARIRRCAGDDGRNAQRRHQHDTRRHPTTSVSSWDGGRRLHLVSLVLRIGRGAGGIEGSTEIARVNLLDHGLARARGWGPMPMMALAARCELRGGARQHSRFNNCGEGGSCGIAR